MGRTGTITVLFTDVVGSTDLLTRLGDREWDDVRRRHFAVLRDAIAEHDGTEVKNTGDGLMTVFGSAVDAVECALEMQQRTQSVVVAGVPVGVRIGIATGEATNESDDWFGTPVVEAARLSALAGSNESWSTALVAALAGSQAKARFVSLGPKLLKGFEAAVDVFNVDAPDGARGSMYAAIDRHTQVGDRLVDQLDYWERLPSIQRMREGMLADLALGPGQTVCDIGCGSGSELMNAARAVGPTGIAIGIDPSPKMIETARDRSARAGIALDLRARDGRDTGLDDDSCDAVRIERVVQHVGDLPAFLAEAMRITRPGGRIVIGDTDWGSLIMHPGDRDVIRRFKAAFEQGPMAEPWAGRLLHGAMLEAGLDRVASAMYPIDAGPGILTAAAPVLERFREMHLVSRAEIDSLMTSLDDALACGGAVIALTMFVASGVVPARL